MQVLCPIVNIGKQSASKSNKSYSYMSTEVNEWIYMENIRLSTNLSFGVASPIDEKMMETRLR